MKVKQNIEQLIGHTPLFELCNYRKNRMLNSKIIAKLELFNPGGSVKDRIALAMIREAIKDGRLKANSTIVEPTSGNTGIGLASIGSAMGFKVILVMPDTMSIERRTIALAYGAQLVLTDGSKGMNAAIEKDRKSVV